MNASVTSTPQVNPTTFTPANDVRDESVPAAPVSSTRELIFELGLWLSGLESFLQIRNHSFGEAAHAKTVVRDWAKEFYLTNSALLLCSKLTLKLCEILKEKENAVAKENEIDFLEGATGSANTSEFSFEEILALSVALKDSVLLNEALLRSAPLKFAEWTSWSNVLSQRLKESKGAEKLIAYAEREGEDFLPPILQDLLQKKTLPPAAEADLRVVLPHFAKILKWLDAIGKMHDNDEPLKPALLLFARINEQTKSMMSYINNRLRRYADEEDALFITLDSVAYAASIEVRKVYNFELAGLSEIRQAPSVYARVETAHGLLNDCFQQIIINFAQFIDPQIQAAQLFPTFQTKLEKSLALRSDLWSIQQAVKKVERGDRDYPTEKLYKKLTDFQKGSMRALFYKDLETVERFIEEVLRTYSKNDIVPILHRFGAYLETLLGQVNMRTILASHPFDYPAE